MVVIETSWHVLLLSAIAIPRRIISKNIHWILSTNLKDFLLIFQQLPLPKKQTPDQRNILIFNWRDRTHKWAGGAESYLNELAKEWVAKGNTVTLFCGNDGKQKRHEYIDGIQVVRRGGFYTVYIWAILYYVIKFRNRFDVVIDSENGIPFFTPLFVRKPKFLLIHHIHQHVFFRELSVPKALMAAFLESKCMPFVYRKQHVVTVSQSSKHEILKRFKHFSSISVVTPGISVPFSTQVFKKTAHPSLLYLGRLKPYKNLPIVIKAFATILQFYPHAKLYIAGNGEELSQLTRLTKKLVLTSNVIFLGRVSERKKLSLYKKCWVMVQPSMVEGWGITVIEANAYSTPVIAANVNGLKDSIVHNKTGILLKKGTEEEFVAAMMQLLADTKLRETLGQNAQAWSQNFVWQQSAQQFYSLITRQTARKLAGATVKRLKFAGN